MKKLFIILTLLLCIALAACDASEEQPDATTNCNTSSSTASDTSDNFDNCTEVYFYEKYGNSVYFAHEEKDTYYSEIREYEKVSNCFDIPKDADGFYKVGAYLKFINSYEDLLAYITPLEFDPGIFDSSYVVCVKQFFYDDAHEKRLIGYYDLACSDGKYSISLDYYKSEEQCPHEQEAIPYEFTTYIVVPKNSVTYTEQLQQITVNGRNDIENEIYADDDGGIISVAGKSSHGYIAHNSSIELPKNSTAWVVEKGSELEKQLGLSSNSYSDFRVVLYLPSEPKYDFIITEKEIKNGSLYLTVEEYTQYTNEYLNRNDVKFYDLYISDTIELVDNFDVYILIKTVE